MWNKKRYLFCHGVITRILLLFIIIMWNETAYVLIPLWTIHLPIFRYCCTVVSRHSSIVVAWSCVCCALFLSLFFYWWLRWWRKKWPKLLRIYVKRAPKILWMKVGEGPHRMYVGNVHNVCSRRTVAFPSWRRPAREWMGIQSYTCTQEFSIVLNLVDRVDPPVRFDPWLQLWVWG